MQIADAIQFYDFTKNVTTTENFHYFSLVYIFYAGWGCQTTDSNVTKTDVTFWNTIRKLLIDVAFVSFQPSYLWMSKLFNYSIWYKSHLKDELYPKKKKIIEIISLSILQSTYLHTKIGILRLNDSNWN